MTSHDSNLGFKEYIVCLLEMGQVTVRVNFLPQNATQSYSAGFLKDWFNRTRRDYAIVFTDAASTTWSFSGFVVGFDAKEPVASQLTADIKIQLTGGSTSQIA